ncbi:MAG: phosphotransferase [Spirochaetales bacterium]|nr:phosphotransferase [Spirochaetales bacterium]
MIKHKKYNLWLHEDSELTELLGSRIIDRVTLHEWPNSCVQKLLLDNNKRLIYKYQSGGDTESRFYEDVSSSILPKTKTLWRDDWFSCMVIEYIETPPMGILEKSDNELIKISYEIIETIKKIKDRAPIILDIGSWEKWHEMASETIKTLKQLIAENRHYGSGLEDIQYMESIIFSLKMKKLYQKEIGLIHGDLNGGNIFPQNNSYKIIDWQSCKIAPLELDRASFISRQGKDPSKLINPEIAYMLYFVNIWWLVKCQTEILKDGNYDNSISYNLTRFKEISIT